MAFKKVANAVVAVQNASGTTYVTIGSLLETDQHDPTKSLPYVLMLDPWTDLGALAQARQQPGTLPVSFYHFEKAARQAPAASRSSRPDSFNPDADSIPF